jgi:Na+-translocating ferredoxin:NAD+ oxidoreductase RNF subunit RnfB
MGISGEYWLCANCTLKIHRCNVSSMEMKGDQKHREKRKRKKETLKGNLGNL